MKYIKAVFFNQYFASQCTQPPEAENHLLPPFEYETQNTCNNNPRYIDMERPNEAVI